VLTFRFAGSINQVLKAYEAQGFDMLLKAFNDTKFLEELTGLDQLYLESEAILDKVELEDEEDDF
jgi:ubiquitin-like modifier-activating enzyme ATG7